MKRFLRIAPFPLLVLIFVILSPRIYAQDTGGNGIDEDLVTRQSDDIDFPGCFSDLQLSDRDGDGFVKKREYLNFIQEYGKRICFQTDSLTLQQNLTFNNLACTYCRSIENAPPNCCLGENAAISTAGALDPDRSPSDANYLTTVCKLTDATIDSTCRPVIGERDKPPVPVLPNSGISAATAGGGGLNDGVKWALIAAAILIFLLCCCCACVVTKKRRRDGAEDDDEEIIATTIRKDMERPLADVEKGLQTEADQGSDEALNSVSNLTSEEPPYSLNNNLESTPIVVAPLAAPIPVAARGATSDESSDEEEETRIMRGGSTLPEDASEEMLQIIGAKRLPPPDPESRKALKLRPAPGQETEDDEWDQPGRDIQFPTEDDEMSGQELDHYVPDGGVYIPQREGKDPVQWNNNWNRERPEEPDEHDLRKHRIQAGLGEGEVWNKLDEESELFRKSTQQKKGTDWIFQASLGILFDNQDNNSVSSGDSFGNTEGKTFEQTNNEKPTVNQYSTPIKEKRDFMQEKDDTTPKVNRYVAEERKGTFAEGKQPTPLTASQKEIAPFKNAPVTKEKPDLQNQEDFPADEKDMPAKQNLNIEEEFPADEKYTPVKQEFQNEEDFPADEQDLPSKQEKLTMLKKRLEELRKLAELKKQAETQVDVDDDDDEIEEIFEEEEVTASEFEEEQPILETKTSESKAPVMKTSESKTKDGTKIVVTVTEKCPTCGNAQSH